MIVDPYEELARSYRLYCKLYGGWTALFTSPYFHAALLLTAALYPVWNGDDGAKIWAAAAQNILPNLMGFSIAGMAVFLAFSHPETMNAITEDGEPESYFVTTVAGFFHFIFVQTIAMMLGFVGAFVTSNYLSAFGVFFLSYAMLVGLAMAMNLLHTAQIINAASSIRRRDDGGKNSNRK